MLKDREKLYQAYHTLLSMALTWALILICNQYFGLKVHVLLTAVYSLIPAFLIYLFDLNKKNIISYILPVGILPILGIIFWLNKINPIKWIIGFIEWCSSYNGSEELYSVQYSNTALAGTAIIGAILFYILTKRQKAKVLLSILIIAVLVTLSINRISISKFVIFTSIFYILTIIVELCGIIYNRRAGRQDKKEGILYLAPICLLLAVLSISLPSKQEPIQWNFVKRAYHNVIEQIEEWKTDWNYYFGKSQNEFFVSLSGYSEDNGDLNSSSKLVKDSKIALKVSRTSDQDTTYLIGSISDLYTGNSWEKSKETAVEGQSEYALDYAELYCALARQKLEVLQNNQFVDRNDIRIKFNNIKTRTFFYPLKTSNYEISSNYHKLTDDTAQITFHKGLGKGTNYHCSYYDLNLQGEAFVQMLRDLDGFSYDASMSMNSEIADWLKSNALFYEGAGDLLMRENLYQILGERAKQIEKQYTVLPKELPERVKSLANDITKEYTSDYDKLKAIEAFLTQYTYSLTPPITPEGRDFIDYFLFDSKEGYCTSFATSMAVLSRCIGLPSRYVEGFVVKFENKDNDGFYPVKNSQAHAWAEVYIKGVGWIPFEATAPFYKSRYSKWAEINNEVSSNVTVPYQNDYSRQQASDLTVGSDIVIVKKNSSKQVFTGIIMFLAVVTCILLTIIVYYNILKYRYKKIFEQSDCNKKMYMLFLRILMLLKREGFLLDQQETILMLAQRVKAHYKYNNLTFVDVAEIYMRYRYAQEEITEADLKKVTIYHKGLFDKKKDEENGLKVWFQELLFLAKKGYR